MKKVTVAELEKVVAELAFENGQMRGELTELQDKYSAFIDLDREWSKKVAQGLKLLVENVSELKDSATVNTAMTVKVMQRMGITMADAIKMVDEAQEAALEAEKMAEGESNVQH